MILGIQLIGLLFGTFMMYFTFLNFKQNKFTGKEHMVWLCIWIVFLVITLFPSVLNPILEALNIYRAMDLYISIGFLFFIIIIFYIYSITRVNQQQIEVLTREIAHLTVKENPTPKSKLRRR